jgi:hypothetical protein
VHLCLLVAAVTYGAVEHSVGTGRDAGPAVIVTQQRVGDLMASAIMKG